MATNASNVCKYWRWKILKKRNSPTTSETSRKPFQFTRRRELMAENLFFVPSILMKKTNAEKDRRASLTPMRKILPNHPTPNRASKMRQGLSGIWSHMVYYWTIQRSLHIFSYAFSPIPIRTSSSLYFKQFFRNDFLIITSARDQSNVIDIRRVHCTSKFFTHFIDKALWW